MKKNNRLFISYSHKDKTFVKRLALDLKYAGVEVYIDEGEIKVGDSLIEKIRDSIDKVDYLAVMISNDSLKSEWVKKEVDIAMNQEIEGKKVKVLPCLLKKCDLPWFLKGKMYADFTKKEYYVDSVNKILSRLGLPNIRMSFTSEQSKYIYYSLTHNFHFDPSNWKSAKWTKTSIFTPIDKIDSWIDRYFVGPGKIKPISTNLGNLGKPYDEGGTLLIPTKFDNELNTGVKYKKEINVECKNTFPESKEYISWIPIESYYELNFNLNFPSNKPFINIDLVAFAKTKKIELNKYIKKNKLNTKASIFIPEPGMGYKYVISWTW